MCPSKPLELDASGHGICCYLLDTFVYGIVFLFHYGVDCHARVSPETAIWVSGEDRDHRGHGWLHIAFLDTKRGREIPLEQFGVAVRLVENLVYTLPCTCENRS